jgi:hypothetical protein
MTDTALNDGTTAGFGKIGYPFFNLDKMLKCSFYITIGILLLSALLSVRDELDSDTVVELIIGGARTFVAVHIFMFIANIIQVDFSSFKKFDVIEIVGMSLLAFLAWRILPRGKTPRGLIIVTEL